MKWHWPWTKRRETKQAAEQSQEAAVRVRTDVILPLRQLAADIDSMRLTDALPAAVREAMVKQLKREGPGDPGRGNTDRR